MIADWKKEIAAAWHVKDETAKLDVQNLWEYHLPRVAATERELAEVEAVIGHRLDARYREFLSFANGWKCFYQMVDLFGTAELSGGGLMDAAQEILVEILPESFKQGPIAKSELLPIAVSQTDRDMFVMTRPGGAFPPGWSFGLPATRSTGSRRSTSSSWPWWNTTARSFRTSCAIRNHSGAAGLPHRAQLLRHSFTFPSGAGGFERLDQPADIVLDGSGLGPQFGQYGRIAYLLQGVHGLDADRAIAQEFHQGRQGPVDLQAAQFLGGAPANLRCIIAQGVDERHPRPPGRRSCRGPRPCSRAR